jgi:hypothetical protein
VKIRTAALVAVVITVVTTQITISSIARETPPADAPAPVLPDRPDAKAPGGDKDLLGPTFESVAAGIGFRAPAGCKEDRRGIGDEIVQYSNEPKRWLLKVNRLRFDKPIPMTYHKNDKNGPDINGLFEETVDRIKTESPNIEIFRQEIVHQNGLDLGLIAGRAGVGAENNLVLIALVRKSPADATNDAAHIYYSFNFTAAGVGKNGPMEQDKGVVEAVDMFMQLLDSVQLLDQTAVREDQNQRLYRTRSLFVNLTETKLRNALVKEQWLRLMRDGKDIGYSYIVEEVAQDLPRTGGRAGGTQAGGEDGVRVGVRSRTMPESGVQVDTETWMWTSFDRHHEKFTNFALVKNATTGNEAFSEIGSYDAQIRLVRDDDLEKGQQGLGKDKKGVDESQPQVRQTEVRTLEVQYKGKGRTGEPFSMRLPAWYMPEALGHLLPRIAAKMEPKNYLFAVYNSDRRVVMNRYIDVLPETSVELDGKKVRAIPVTDHLGLEGPVTTHYLSKNGQYLGSISKDSGITILPTDAATLEKMWKDANLTRPGEVEGK